MSYLAPVPTTRLRLPWQARYDRNVVSESASGATLDRARLGRRLRQVRAHFALPASRRWPTIEERFRQLAEEWQRQTAPSSSLTQIVLHPAYQQIIGLGPSALPLIMAELERAPGHWFWALKAITGVDPVPPEKRGNLDEMRACWLAWAREQGLTV